MSEKHPKKKVIIPKPRPDGEPTPPQPTYGAYAMQPITKPDSRFPQTGVARPDESGVEENRDWVMENKK